MIICEHVLLNTIGTLLQTLDIALHVIAVALQLSLSLIDLFLDGAILVILTWNTRCSQVGLICQVLSIFSQFQFCPCILTGEACDSFFFFLFDVAHQLFETFKVELDVALTEELDQLYL